MSDTRQVWNPWRANTRTAASRIMRRLSTAWRAVAITLRPPRPAGGGAPAPSARPHLGRPAVRLRAPVRERRQRAADRGEAVEVQVGRHDGLRIRRLREHDAPGVDDHRAAAGAVARRVLADLVGGDDEALVLDRPR